MAAGCIWPTKAPSRAQEYERAIRALLDTVEAVIGATEIRATRTADRSDSDGE